MRHALGCPTWATLRWHRAVSPAIASSGCTSSLLAGWRDVVGRAALRHVELSGFAARDAERSPIGSGVVFGEQDDLADMSRVVGELPIERLDHRVRFPADANGLAKILWRKRGDGQKHMVPSVLPHRHDLLVGVFSAGHELVVAIPARFFPVGGEEVGPTR